MGKRELLIICAFLVIGAVTYQFTAAPAKPGERSFSIGDMFRGIKREMSANASSARLTKSGSFALTPDIKQVHISTARSVPVTIVGEDRKDIGFEMPVRSNGPDEATAKEWANKVELRQDLLGSTISLSTYFPEEGSQNAELTLKVPKQLQVRVENSTKIQASSLAAVELKNPSGEVNLVDVGEVTGTHRSGDLTISGATTVNVALVSSRTKIKNVSNGVTVNVRNGECWVSDTAGDVTATISNDAELTVTMDKSDLKVSGDGGRLKILRAANKVSIDTRRTLVEVEAGSQAGDEFTIVTSDEDIRLSLGDPVAASIDAATTGGVIRADDFKLQPEQKDNQVRMNASIGKGGSRIVLRNSRGDIVISKRK